MPRTSFSEAPAISGERCGAGFSAKSGVLDKECIEYRAGTIAARPDRGKERSAENTETFRHWESTATTGDSGELLRIREENGRGQGVEPYANLRALSRMRAYGAAYQKGCAAGRTGSSRVRRRSLPGRARRRSFLEAETIRGDRRFRTGGGRGKPFSGDSAAGKPGVPRPP